MQVAGLMKLLKRNCTNSVSIGREINFAAITVLSLALSLLTACGGGGGSTTSGSGTSATTAATANTGVFADAPTDGLEYRTATQSGTTSNGGQFKYAEGETITFSIGGTTLGSATAKAVLTPVDIVPGATDETNATVVKITQLILSLADDASSSTLNISAASRAAMQNVVLDFSASQAAFEAAIMAVTGKTPVSTATAQSHLATTLAALNGTSTTSYQYQHQQ